MAWPPPVLATNRTNATPQLDAHAADHNALALGLNDTVAHIVKRLVDQRRHRRRRGAGTDAAGRQASPPARRWH